ncbi:hypothetical protein MAR_034483, partial [Mya arenaria]
ISGTANLSDVETKSLIVSLFSKEDRKFCPGTDVNLTERSQLFYRRNNSGSTICCADCSSDDDCAFYNDCCFPPNATPQFDSDEKCVKAVSVQNSSRIFTSPAAFYMVTSCPSPLCSTLRHTTTLTLIDILEDAGTLTSECFVYLTEDGVEYSYLISKKRCYKENILNKCKWFKEHFSKCVFYDGRDMEVPGAFMLMISGSWLTSYKTRKGDQPAKPFTIMKIGCFVRFLRYKPVESMCSSYESLCGMNYRFVTEDGDPVELLNSKSDICKCQNNVTCSSDWFNLTNAIVQTLLTGNDLQLEARITFCQLPTNQEPCKFGDPVLTTKGHGQFSFELASPMNCKCNRPLFAQSAWRVGLYDYITYGCGQYTNNWPVRASTDHHKGGQSERLQTTTKGASQSVYRPPQRGSVRAPTDHHKGGQSERLQTTTKGASQSAYRPPQRGPVRASTDHHKGGQSERLQTTTKGASQSAYRPPQRGPVRAFTDHHKAENVQENHPGHVEFSRK